MVLGSLFYMLAPIIANFFQEPDLVVLLRFSIVIIFLESFTIVQKTRLIKDFNFKLETKITFWANLVSGLIAIYLVYSGYGIWGLLWRLILLSAFKNIVLWTIGKWIPRFELDLISFKALLNYGYKIFLSHAVANFFVNIYNFVIGGYISSTALGYFTTAKTYSSIIPQTINTTLQKVVFSVYSKLQNDDAKLKEISIETTKSVMYATFFVMMLLIVIAEPLFTLLLDDNWKPFIIYFQVLCAGYLMLPLIPLNQIILMVKGRTDLVLRTDFIKYIFQVPFIIAGLFFGIEFIVFGFAFFWWSSFIICAWYTKGLINYSIKEQTIHIFPYFFICMAICLGGYSVAFLNIFETNLSLLMAQVLTSITLFFAINELFGIHSYIRMKLSLITLLQKT